jgi:hypothetical protein
VDAGTETETKTEISAGVGQTVASLTAGASESASAENTNSGVIFSDGGDTNIAAGSSADEDEKDGEGTGRNSSISDEIQPAERDRDTAKFQRPQYDNAQKKEVSSGTMGTFDASDVVEDAEALYVLGCENNHYVKGKVSSLHFSLAIFEDARRTLVTSVMS